MFIQIHINKQGSFWSGLFKTEKLVAKMEEKAVLFHYDYLHD